MNCLEFRRLCLADPGRPNLEYLRHKRECPTCGSLALGVEQFDRTLHEAVNVEVPEALQSRILLRRSIGENHIYQQRRRWVLAVAASVFLTVGVLFAVLQLPETPALGQVALAHIDGEPDALIAREEVGNAVLKDLFDGFGIELKGGLGKVTHATRCQIREAQGAHLVLTGSKGPVTLLVMPGEYVGERAVFSDRKFSGIIIPADGGSLAIVGERGEALDKVEQHVRKTIQWL